MDIHIDTREAIKTIQNTIGKLAGQQNRLYISDALNRAAITGNSIIKKQVASEYFVTQSEVGSTINLVKSGPSTLTAMIKSTSKVLRVQGFPTSQVQTRTPKRVRKGSSSKLGGVNVKISKGKTGFIRHAWKGTIKGEQQILARGKYIGRKFVYGNFPGGANGRPRRQALYTFSIANSIRITGSKPEFQQKVMARFIDRYTYHVKRILKA